MGEGGGGEEKEAFPYSEYIFALDYEVFKIQFLLGFYFYFRKELTPCRSLLRSVTSGGIVCYPITGTSRFWMCHTIW